MKNADQSAYPTERINGDMARNIESVPATSGLTKREYFAGLALQALIIKMDPDRPPSDVAINSVWYADELLKQLEQGN